MTELAVSVNHPGGPLKHHELEIDDTTTVGEIREDVDAPDVESIMLHHKGETYTWQEPDDSTPVVDLLDDEALKTLLLFHPGGWETVVGNPFDVHPWYKDGGKRA